MKRIFRILTAAFIICGMTFLSSSCEELLEPFYRVFLAEDWSSEYDEDGGFIYDHVVEHYFFSEDGTGYYERFLFKDGKLVEVPYSRNGSGLFTYSLTAIKEITIHLNHTDESWIIVVDRESDQFVSSGGHVFKLAPLELIEQMDRWVRQDILVVLPHEMNITSKGYGGFGVEVKTNVAYNIIMPEGITWLRHLEHQESDGSTEFFVFDENNSYDERTAKVIFKGEKINLSDTLFVWQLSMKGFELPELYCTIDNSEQDVTVKVLSNVDYTVNIIDGSDWVSKVTTKSLVEESNLFHVTANPTNEYRTATIEFKSGKLTRQYFINQTPFPPGNVPFEDSNFKKYCVTYYDVNKDGEISFEEASWITDIGISTMDISSVKGIEYMPNLKKLACQGSNGWDEESQESFGLGKLTSIDVSHNPELTFLDVDCNQLTSIDVSNNLALTTLFLGFNKLTSIDISHNTALTKFSCYVNKVASLDLSHNPLLEELYCGHNQLQVLDVSSNPLLKKVECDYNMLSSLDISHNPLLVRVECYENQLTQIIMTSSTNLEYFDCMFNKLLALDVSKNTGLNNLRCSHNNLQTLDVSNNLNLTNLECGNNANGIIIWLKTGQVISSFSHDGSADIKYKD